MIIFTNRKIFLLWLLVLLAVLLSAILIFTFFPSKSQNSFDNKTSDNKNQEETPTPQSEDSFKQALNQMTMDDFIKEGKKKIMKGDLEVDGWNLSVYSFFESSIFRLLECQFQDGQYSEEKIEEILKEDKENQWDEWGIKYVLSAKHRPFSVALSDGDLKKICPDELVALCQNRSDYEKSFYPSDKNWCANLCSQVVIYEKNQEKFEKEVLDISQFDFKQDWPQQFVWRLVLAYRFGGPATGQQICSQITDTVNRLTCYKGLAKIKLKGTSCEQVKKNLIDVLWNNQKN